MEIKTRRMKGNEFIRKKRLIKINKGCICQWCSGTGKAYDLILIETKRKICPVCNGKGWMGLKDNYSVEVYDF